MGRRYKLAGLRKRETKVSRKLGLFIDRVSILGLLLSFLLGIIAFGLSFYFLSFIDQGITSSTHGNEIGIGDAFYFSVVTISSLGYGDYSPVGFGRLVSIVEVLFGLVFLAVVVAKLAGQRQSIIIRLTYQAVQEQRILQFVNETNATRVWLGEWMWGAEKPTRAKMHKKLSNATHEVKLIHKYIGAQSGLGMLSEVDLRKWIFPLMKNLSVITNRALEISKSQILTRGERKKVDSLAYFSIEVIRSYVSSTNDNGVKRLLTKAEHEWNLYRKVRYTLPRRAAEEPNPQKYSARPTEDILEKVANELPKQPWPKNIHREIATKLQISNRAVHKAIDELIRVGRFSPQWKGKVIRKKT